jgi:DNA polymerase-1
MSDKFVIVDGSSLVHRAFYALPLLSTASGQYTNAVYGFTTMLLKLIEDVKPDSIAVAFDKGRITFRNEQYKEYKAQRKPTPKELSEQFSLVKDVLSGLGIAMLEKAGFEGDDIIGTLAVQAEKRGCEVVIVTGDRDALQLITDQTKVLLTKKGISEMDLMDAGAVEAKYGVTPRQIIDLKGLMGDTSDNIPGVPGIGEKTATKLISEFGCVETLLANLDKVSGKKLQENLRNNVEAAIISKKLATIQCDVPMDDLPDSFIMQPQVDKLYELFIRLEFKSLAARIMLLFSDNPVEQIDKRTELQLPTIDIIVKGYEVMDILCKARTADVIAVYPLLAGHIPATEIKGMAISFGDEGYYIDGTAEHWDEVLGLLADESVRKITHDAKKVLNACNSLGIAAKSIEFDTLLAGYLMEPTASEYTLPSLAARYGEQQVDWTEKKHGHSPEYIYWAAQAINELYQPMTERLQGAGLDILYREIELPLIKVLAAMESTGIRVDRQALRNMAIEISERIGLLLTEIYRLAEEEFNVNSTKQLGSILFEKLKLPAAKKTKTGYSTDAEVLEGLAGQHEIIDKLLEYRVLTKLKSTYLDGMDVLINNKTDRIYTTFNQTVTATGRLSSSDPNLQNIPIRTDIGRRIRELFVPGEGYDCIMSADYSQIELRILAHISGDPGLQDAFVTGQDIHTRTASEVFGIPLAEVTGEMRSRAKAVNFGIVYGISDYGLSRDIGVTRKEAGQYIDNYFDRYKGVKTFMDEVIASARTTGYVTTLFGRRRFLPDINSRNFNLRSFAERTAMNTPIQGTAADVIKKAMIDVSQALQEKQLSSRLLLQVHDELVLEVKAEEVEVVGNMIKQAMEKAVSLNVPLIADIKTGPNWAKAK